MGIWFLTARRRWSIRSMAMSNGAAARGNTTRQRQLTLIGLLTAITFEDAAPLTDSCDGSAGRGTARGGTRATMRGGGLFRCVRAFGPAAAGRCPSRAPGGPSRRIEMKVEHG